MPPFWKMPPPNCPKSPPLTVLAKTELRSRTSAPFDCTSPPTPTEMPPPVPLVVVLPLTELRVTRTVSAEVGTRMPPPSPAVLPAILVPSMVSVPPPITPPPPTVAVLALMVESAMATEPDSVDAPAVPGPIAVHDHAIEANSRVDATGHPGRDGTTVAGRRTAGHFEVMESGAHAGDDIEGPVDPGRIDLLAVAVDVDGVGDVEIAADVGVLTAAGEREDRIDARSDLDEVAGRPGVRLVDRWRAASSPRRPWRRSRRPVRRHGRPTPCRPRGAEAGPLSARCPPPHRCRRPGHPDGWLPAGRGSRAESQSPTVPTGMASTSGELMAGSIDRVRPP